MNTETIIKRARVDLFLKYPFWSLLGLQMDWEISTTVPTMATDGKRLFINPDFTSTLTQAEVIGVLAHEISHAAWRHPERGKGMLHEFANMAMDFAVNLTLIDDWGLTLPSFVLYDAQYRGMTMEQIYSKLVNQKGKTGGQPGKPKDGSGSDNSNGRYRPTQSDPSKDKLAGDLKDPAGSNGKDKGSDKPIDWSVEVERAYRIANSRGTLPGGVARRMAESKRTPEDWRAIMLRFVQSIVVCDSSFTRPSRRGISQGLYLPGPVKDGMGTLAVGLDTSGSIGDALIGDFMVNLQAIQTACKPEKIVVYMFHSRVYSTVEFAIGDEIILPAKESGGTSFTPVFNRIDHDGVNPVCCIMLSDIQGDNPREPDYPVLWCYPIESTYHSVDWGQKIGML